MISRRALVEKVTEPTEWISSRVVLAKPGSMRGKKLTAFDQTVFVN